MQATGEAFGQKVVPDAACMTPADLADAQIASIMGWSEAEIERIRRIYVDDTARQIALDKRIARGLIAD